MSDMFTRSNYKLNTARKDGQGVIKFLKEPNVERYTVITQTKVRISPSVPIPGRDSVLYSTRTVQTFSSKDAGLAEYNRQQARLQYHGWERKIPNGRNSKEYVRSEKVS